MNNKYFLPNDREGETYSSKWLVIHIIYRIFYYLGYLDVATFNLLTHFMPMFYYVAIFTSYVTL